MEEQEPWQQGDVTGREGLGHNSLAPDFANFRRERSNAKPMASGDGRGPRTNDGCDVQSGAAGHAVRQFSSMYIDRKARGVFCKRPLRSETLQASRAALLARATRRAEQASATRRGKHRGRLRAAGAQAKEMRKQGMAPLAGWMRWRDSTFSARNGGVSQ